MRIYDEAPFVRADSSVSGIMADVCIALLPPCVFGVFMFGARALWVILVSVGACVMSEYIYEKLTKSPVTLRDGSAAVTGLVLAVNLPAAIPLWMAAAGGAFAIIIVKQLFGGLGKNFMNPALAARCFLLMSFGASMSTFPKLDMASGATPLAAMKAGESADLLQLLLGQHSGTIGETSVLAILLGGVYLICRGVISPRIPLTYIASAGAFTALLMLIQGRDVSPELIAAQMMAGGLLLGAFFMATDYVTAPATPAGRIICGVVLGLLTALFRVLGSGAEGVSFAILIGNLLVPFIERRTLPAVFGKRGSAQ